MTPIERAKRFWAAHGRSADDLMVLHAFCNNPAVSWSPESLCIWYGIRIDRAYRIVDELARCGIVRPAQREERGYRWNDAHDWAVPLTAAARRVVQERWVAEAVCPADPAPAPNAREAEQFGRGAPPVARGEAHAQGDREPQVRWVTDARDAKP